MKINLCCCAGGMIAAMFLTGALVAAPPGVPPAAPGINGDILVLTSTNNATKNEIVVFKLNTTGTPSLSLMSMFPTGGAGGASTNAGAVQFGNSFGAVVNYGSNDVSQLVRAGDSINVSGTIKLATGCDNPVSVALTQNQLFVVGSNCAESHMWPSGNLDGSVVGLKDTSAAQIALGETWAAVTLTSGSVLQLPLSATGALNGTSTSVTLPGDADMVPLGATFWGDLLGFDPAHSPDSFALLTKSGTVIPVLGPQPPYMANAPCWIAKGPGNLWYTGNSPGKAVSIFFSDGQGGAFYKSVSLPGAPTDITVSPDRHWLAVIYSNANGAYVAVFTIDAYGDLSLAATSNAMSGVTFSGVAFSE